MLHRVRDRVSELTILLSGISLALVFGAVLGAVPRTAIPAAPDIVFSVIPHLNAGISLLAIAVISFGWRSIRHGHVRRHRAAMLSGVALFTAFLVLYLYKVAAEGPTQFAGPAVIERFVYLPLLAIHITLAVVCVPLLYYVLLLALTRSVEEIPVTPHPRIGRIAASLWIVSFSLGLVVYFLLYHAPFSAGG